MRSPAEDVLDEVERLARGLPIPNPSWHGCVPEMHAMRANLLAAVVAIRELPAAAHELLRQVDGAADRPPDDAGGPFLRRARRELRSLPLPAGEHPFLDEIMPTFEAAEAALAALASVHGGEAAFADASSANGTTASL
jgi:hypothetical protein